jgi:hypothetical protein
MDAARPRPPVVRARLPAMLLALLGVASAQAAEPPRGETLNLRVSVDAAGKVASATPMDPAAALNAAAQAYAAKLVFTPAKKDGVAVPSQTCLTMRLEVDPRPDGRFGLKLRRAVNGPCVVLVGKADPPKLPREQGGMVVAGADLRADGSVEPSSVKIESMVMSVPSSFAEARYADFVEKSLRGTRFEVDTVDGAKVPTHVSMPYRFGRGAKKPPTGESRTEREQAMRAASGELQSVNAKSLQAGVELAKIDFSQ